MSQDCFTTLAEKAEQVGKAGLPVPDAAVAKGREVLRATLKRGDVLYVPRGLVHEARTSAADSTRLNASRAAAGRPAARRFVLPPADVPRPAI